MNKLTITQLLLGALAVRFEDLSINDFKAIEEFKPLFEKEEFEFFEFLYSEKKLGKNVYDYSHATIFYDNAKHDWLFRSIRDNNSTASLDAYIKDLSKKYGEFLLSQVAFQPNQQEKNKMLAKANDLLKPQDIQCDEASGNTFLSRLMVSLDKGEEYIKLPNWYQFTQRVHIEPSNLILICGVPGTCKTSFALNLSIELSRANKKGLFISLEMGIDELIKRVVSITSSLPLNQITKTGHQNMNQNEMHKFNIALDFFNDKGKNLNFRYVSGATPNRIREQVDRLKPDYLVVDYIQLLKGDYKYNNRENEISDISRALKNIAMDYKIPVFALAQLNREVTKRTDKRPKSSDLKDSSSLEADANTIIGLYRESVFNPTITDTTLELCITKQRNGGLGTIYADFISKNQRVILKDSQSWQI